MTPSGPRSPARRPAHRRALALGVAVAGALALVVGIVGFPPGAGLLLRLDLPRPGQIVGVEGLEVRVRFPGASRVAPGSFRALLNGADVTAAFELRAQGARARLHGLLEGENRLRVEVLGHPWWPSQLLLEASAERSVLHRPPLHAQRG